MHYFVQSKAKIFSKAQFTRVNEQFENIFNTAMDEIVHSDPNWLDLD